jgi:CHAT domain-containing protein
MAIEIIRLNIYNDKWTDTVKYVALIIKPTSKYPEMIVLENGNELEGKYAKNYQNCIKGKANDKYSYEQYWSKISENIKGVNKVFLSVDGVYNSINLNTLQNLATGKYVGEEVEIQLVSNTKDLITQIIQNKQNNNKKAVLIGFPDYNNKHKNNVPKKEGREKDIKMDSTQRFFDGSNISELVGTKTEVENIENMLQKAKIVTQSYTEGQASEEMVKKLDSPYILHIATHGFFMKDVENNYSFDTSIMNIDNKKLVENPLLRSGLLFANAKEALKEGGDGVLTAYEAMNLNLDNTDLVVLSACETGLGEIRNGEGVYGLQRAFQTAGAKTVLMSLWTVSDEATQQLMTLFYENLITQKQSKREAFRNSQNELKKKFPEPYYWGAFVMVGE